MRSSEITKVKIGERRGTRTGPEGLIHEKLKNKRNKQNSKIHGGTSQRNQEDVSRELSKRRTGNTEPPKASNKRERR